MVIQMEKDGGVYKIPCLVNGLRLKLIFDTGASNVCISQSVAEMMLENDYLSLNDIKGTAQSQVADGRIVDHAIINLKKIQIGEKVLTNVEAVVIYGQSAPLLLGQSALKRLGRYSISSDKLIIGTNVPLSSVRKTSFTEEEIDLLIKEADDSYINDVYAIAMEKYGVLYENDLLSAYGKMRYANCYYYTNRKEEALQIYFSIQEEIENEYPQYRYPLYCQIGRSLWSIEDYDASIPYIEKAKYYADPWSEEEKNMVEILSNAYENKGDNAKAKRILEEYISRYLSFMEIKATDCWDKLYVDDFLADLYYSRYLTSGSNMKDLDKYLIIAAAWGYKKAIENCKEYKLNYSSKPYNYEY